MKRVLDTNIVSAIMKGDSTALARLQQLDRADVALPQPVVAEIAYGLARLPPSRRRDHLQDRFDRIRAELVRAAWTDAVSDRFGEVKAILERRGVRIDDFDAAIAAHALAAGAVLVTANLAHMTGIPKLKVEDWTAAIR
jgi:tRNA(fMet)-specific endonuclease VapC